MKSSSRLLNDFYFVCLNFFYGIKTIVEFHRFSGEIQQLGNNRGYSFLGKVDFYVTREILFTLQFVQQKRLTKKKIPK